MNIVFCLFQYFPFGGLQRDFLKIAQLCCERGHHVCVLTKSWHGEKAKDLEIAEIPVKALSNHAQSEQFSRLVAARLERLSHDVVVGFNKMPGLDVYFAADPCYQFRVKEAKSVFYRLTPRYRSLLALERSVFDPAQNTAILLLSPSEKDKYIASYHTPDHRFHLLPPGISETCFRKNGSDQNRALLRRSLNLREEDRFLLMVGSAFHTKGVDRTIRALSSLPDFMKHRCCLYIIGKGQSGRLIALAKKLGVADRVNFLGGRNDVPKFLQAADLLVHPARTENTGTVLVEAMAAGLPVLTTANCGYAFHVKSAQAGVVLDEPFDQNSLNRVLSDVLGQPDLAQFRQNGLAYTRDNDVTSLHQKAVEIIEKVAARRTAS
jgi:UDP-glucose:(heptosyl)LPS alpha-1,3-glucosyltransferase